MEVLKTQKLGEKVKITKNNIWSRKKNFSPKTRKNNHLDDSHSFSSDTFQQSRKMASFKEYVKDEKKEIFSSDENLPDKICGSYVFDYNIFQIHSILMKKFEQNRKNGICLLQSKINIHR